LEVILITLWNAALPGYAKKESALGQKETTPISNFSCNSSCHYLVLLRENRWTTPLPSSRKSRNIISCCARSLRKNHVQPSC
jgi:hypothetical protein